MSDRTFELSKLATGIAAILASAPQAVAQVDTIEEIIVTGSHIRRTEYSGRAPVQIVDAETLELNGAAQMIDALKELTVNNGSAMVNETGSGLSTQFNIRNLGRGSTLTLVNGKRAGVTISGSGDFVDINQFPLVMIKRVEVLTDGASATYGSEAVAGVANIITRKGFEGFEISGGYSTAEIDAWQLGLVAGSQFDHGGFNIYAAYYEQGHIERSEFDWMQDRLVGQGDISRSRFLSSTGAPGSYRRAVPDPLTGEAMDVAGTRNHPDPNCEAAGGVHLNPLDTGGFPDNTCRYHFVDQLSVISPHQRAQVFTEFDWKFSDSIRYYSEISFSNSLAQPDRGGTPFNTGRAVRGGTTVLPSHPFNFFIEDPDDSGGLIWIDPANWDPANHTAATLRMIARPLGAEVNNNEFTQHDNVELDHMRIMNGLEVTLPGDWKLDASYGWAKVLRVQNSPHNYRSAVFQDLVRSGEWNPFGTRLADPELVSPKDAADTTECAATRGGVCTAGNPHTSLEKFDQRAVNTSRTTQQVIDVVASGDAFSLGDTTVAMALGGQFREILNEAFPDSLESAGEGNDSRIFSSLRGRQSVLAFFAEAIVPIGEIGEIQLAVRNEDYGSGVATTDPKFSFEIAPTEWLGFRGSWGTSFQAPSLRQTTIAGFSAFLDDPASPTGPGGSLICNDTGLNNSVSVTRQGSPDLTPQESENFALGVVIQTERFRGSIDYFNFDYTNLIAESEGAQAILENDCDDDGIPNDPRIVRDAGGQLRAVVTHFENIGFVETDGIDINADYAMEFGNSTLILDIGATIINKFDVDTSGDGTVDFDGAGSRNFRNNFHTMPEIRGNVGGTWFAGNHSANLTARYIDSYRNDQSNDAKVDSWAILDAQYSYTFPGLVGDGDTTLTIGVNNIADEDPPALVRAASDGTPITRFRPDGSYRRGWIDRPGYDSFAGHDVRGRIVYFRFKQSF